ncbi:M15 family metallopeptidase, partial [Alistipes finegoldii]
AEGRISAEACRNRQLLGSVMREAGLVPYRREWWHYEEPMAMSEVRTRYKLLDF